MIARKRSLRDARQDWIMLCPFPSLALDPGARVDPYRYVHKAIRVVLGRLLESAGKTDFLDGRAVARLRGELEAAVELLRTHGRTEVLYLDALLGAHAPSEASGVQRQHVELEDALYVAVRDLDLAIEGGAQSRERGHAFYLSLSRFVAAYLVHIADEEERVLPLLHRHVDEIVLRRALVAAQSSIPYEERARTYVLVLDAVSPHERRELAASRSRYVDRAQPVAVRRGP